MIDLQREHREAFLAFVLNEAEPWHRQHLGRLYADWQNSNDLYYDGVLVPPILLLAEPSTPRTYGQCATVSSYGARSEIRIRPSLLRGTHPHIRAGAPAEGRHLFASDVLLHEQIHQHQFEVTGNTDEAWHGHGPAFRDTANRIGHALGLPPVRTSKKRGKDAGLPSCSQWPHCVRDPAFYLHAYRPVVARTRTIDRDLAPLISRYGIAAIANALASANEDAP